MGLKAFSPSNVNIESYSSWLLSCRTISGPGRLQRPSALMCRHIRTSLTMSFSKHIKDKETNPEKANFVVQKKLNTDVRRILRTCAIRHFDLISIFKGHNYFHRIWPFNQSSDKFLVNLGYTITLLFFLLRCLELLVDFISLHFLV